MGDELKLSLLNGFVLLFTLLSDIFTCSFVFDISIRLATGGSFMCKTLMPLLLEPNFFLISVCKEKKNIYLSFKVLNESF